MKDFIVVFFVFYIVLSSIFFAIRATPTGHPERTQDCVVRYMDYIFPLSRIHCPVDTK